MKVVVTIQHAGHVHFFKHAIAALEAEGHEVFVFARDNEMSTELLDRCGIDYELLAGSSESLLSLATNQCLYEGRLLQRALEIRPDVMTAIGGVAVSHVASAVGARSVVFYDTEHATIICRLAYPFADTVCTPECYADDIGDKQVRYPGYHELAYLHPDRFTPDPDALAGLDAAPDDTLVVFRLVRWDAMHNAGGEGFENPEEVVERLEATGASVLITSEQSLPPALEEHRATVATHRMHDLLAYADLFVGESGTMTAESAVLGTPSIYVHENDTGLTDDLAEYGLVYPFHGPDRHEAGLEKAISILEGREGADWDARRERLLDDRRDTTDVIVERLLHAGGR